MTPSNPDDDFQFAVSTVVRIALMHDDAARFLAWMREHGARLFLGVMGQQDMPSEMQGPFASMLGMELWNHLPRPDNDFKPRKLREPGRNDPCICGSGLKYKQCCGGVGRPPPAHGPGTATRRALQPRPPVRLRRALARTARPLPPRPTVMASRRAAPTKPGCTVRTCVASGNPAVPWIGRGAWRRPCGGNAEPWRHGCSWSRAAPPTRGNARGSPPVPLAEAARHPRPAVRAPRESALRPAEIGRRVAAVERRAGAPRMA